MGITLPAVRPVPGLPPFDPAAAIPLSAACRRGLVPGAGGRRMTPDVLAGWALNGVRLAAVGPPYLFPAVRTAGQWQTTSAWCVGWVRFVARARTRDGRSARGSGRSG